MTSRFQKLLLATSALVPLGFAPAAANPLGAQVVGGSASVQGQGTANVTVTQSSSNAIINWNTFNIGANEKTQFIQPSSSSIALNRVTGGLGPSQIFGMLSANGRIFVVNPDGILIGPGAKIDTAGFLATTHDIANADFMAGRYNFSIPGNPSASVVNQGTITAQSGGFAALVAPGVRNTGTITANLGTVALASGNGFTLDFYGDKLITLGLSDSIAAQVKDVSTGQTLSSLVSNEGKLKANGGTVQLTAVAARAVVDSVINNRGVIEANTIGTHNGMIVLGAATGKSKPAGAPTQLVKVSGKLSAAGKRKGTTGGTVQITGEAIALAGANIDASGRAGGGTVLIGGDVGGGNPNPAAAGLEKAQLQPWAVPTATTVSVDAATTINVSAKDTGDGGKAAVWADGSTTFNGSISARGGAQSGNGGFVETSGHQQLAFAGTVDTGAPNGTSGTLFLDPLNATIDTNSGNQVITVSSIQSALASGNVIVSTNTSGSDAGDITVAASFNWSNASALTLSANRNINVNNGVIIKNTGSGNLALRADSAGTGTGTITITGSAKIDYSASTGTVSLFYNPQFGYVFPVNYAPFVLTNGAVPNQFTAYMLVNNADNLQAIQQNLSGTYALGKDIDASATANWNAGAGFLPIGSDYGNPFTGKFDGFGGTITGLTINRSSLQSLNGLFGVSNGDIRNVGLSNSHITGADETGALVGYNTGTIANAWATGTIKGNANDVGGLVGENFGTIDTAWFGGVVIGTNNYVGGLVGISRENSVIKNSYATSNVTGLGTVGGLAGGIFGTISNSYASGSVTGTGDNVGGLVGYANGSSITNSYSTGDVTGAYGVGGLVGSLFDVVGITNTYASGKVTGTGASGGSVGAFYYGHNITNTYYDSQTTGQSGTWSGTPLTTATLKTSLPTGLNSSVWGTGGSTNSGYPYLLWQTASAPTPPSPTVLTPAAAALIAVTVTADSFSKVYGTADPTLTYHITSGSLTGSDAFSGALTRTAGQNVGIYAINLGSLALPSTYTLTYVGGNLTITAASLTITADNKSRQAGSGNPAFTASYSGFVSGDNSNVVSGLTFSTPATTSSSAGTYAITPSGASASNYTISYVNGVLTVASATTATPTPTTPTLPSGTTPSATQQISTIIAESTAPVIPSAFITSSAPFSISTISSSDLALLKNLFKDAPSALKSAETLEGIVQMILNLHTYDKLGSLISTLRGEGLKIPPSLSVNYTNVGDKISIGAAHQILDLFVDAALDSAQKSGHPFPLGSSVAHSLADTVFNSATLLVNPKEAVGNQIKDQTFLVINEVAGTISDYSRLVVTFEQAGLKNLNYVRNKGPNDQKTLAIFQSSIAVNENIANELLNGAVIVRPQSDAAIKLQIIDKIIIGAVAQLNGHDGAAAAALSAAKDLATQADSNAPVFAATALTGSHDFRDFATRIATDYKVSGW